MQEGEKKELAFFLVFLLSTLVIVSGKKKKIVCDFS